MSKFVTPWTVACQAPLSLGLSWQKYWSGQPFPSPDLPDPGIEPSSPALLAQSLPFELPRKPWVGLGNGWGGGGGQSSDGTGTPGRICEGEKVHTGRSSPWGASLPSGRPTGIRGDWGAENSA